MKPHFYLLLLFISVTLHVHAQNNAETLDKKKIEKLIKQIRKRPELRNYHKQNKDFSLSDVSFKYDERAMDEVFSIEVFWKGQLILNYGVDRKTFEIRLIIDLR